HLAHHDMVASVTGWQRHTVRGGALRAARGTQEGPGAARQDFVKQSVRSLVAVSTVGAAWTFCRLGLPRSLWSPLGSVRGSASFRQFRLLGGPIANCRGARRQPPSRDAKSRLPFQGEAPGGLLTPRCGSRRGERRNTCGLAYVLRDRFMD